MQNPTPTRPDRPGRPPGRAPRRARRLGALALVAALVAVAAACGSDNSGDRSSAPTTAAGDPTATPDAPATEQRVLALGEERVLADLLALGITPIASSANIVLDQGFVGIDADTTGIESFSSTVENREALADLHPDVVVVNEFTLEQLGRDYLDRLAAEEVVVVPETDAAEQVTVLGEAFGREDRAAELVADLEEARDAGREALADLPEAQRRVSVLTVYSGPSLAAWVDGPVEVPATLQDLGFTLSPGPDDVKGATGGATRGRAYLSEEMIGLFDAPTIVALQSDQVDGEDEAWDAITAGPLWERLPAVAADRVFTVDRLGYPGVVGHTRLVNDLVDLMGA